MSRDLKNRRSFQQTTLQEAVQTRVAALSKVKGSQVANQFQDRLEVLFQNLVTAEHVYRKSNGTATITSLQTAGTQVSNVITNNGGKFEYFDLYAGVYPDLIAHKLISTTEMKQINAYWTYTKYVYGTSKGETVAGTVALDPWNISTDIHFASQLVNNELVAVFTAIPETDHTLVQTPVVPKTVNLTIFDSDGVVKGTGIDKGDGTIAAGAEGYAITGTINHGTGEFSLSFGLGTTPSNTDVLKATYEVDYEIAPTQLGSFRVETGTIPLNAKVHGLNGDFSFLAGFIYDAQFNESLQETLKKGAIAEIKREQDLNVIEALWYHGVKGTRHVDPITNDVVQSTGHDALKFVEPTTGDYQFLHDLSAIKFINKLSNRVLEWTQRVTANILVAGVNWLTLIKAANGFIPTAKEISGSVLEIGSWNGYTIIANPSYRNFAYLKTTDTRPTAVSGADRILAIYKGGEKDSAGILSTFVPIVATPLVVRSNLTVEQAFVSLYDLKVFNASYISAGYLSQS